MAPQATTPVTRFICTSKRCLKVFRSLAVRKKKPSTPPTKVEECPPPPQVVPAMCRLRRETFHLSTTSLRRGSVASIDTAITLLDEPLPLLTCHQENRINEKIEVATSPNQRMVVVAAV